MESRSYTGIWPLAFLLILLAFLAYFFFYRKNADADTPLVAQEQTQASVGLAALQQRGVLRIAFEPDSPPMYYKQASTARGFDVELAEDLAARLGIAKIDFVEADYDQLPDLVRTGKADVLMSGYIPDEDIEGINWSRGYLDFGFCLIAKKGSQIQNIQDLQGKLVGIYEDEVAEAWVKKNISGARTIKYQGVNWLKYVDQGEVAGAVYDYPFAVEEIKPFSDLKIVALNLNTAQYAMGVSDQNDALLRAINKQIGIILETPRYERLVQTYLKTNALAVEELPETAKTYTVQAGDNLGRIAQTVLGSREKWSQIWQLNKNRIPNPHLILPGSKLVIP